MPQHRRHERFVLRFAAPCALLLASSASLAVPSVNDAVGDFLPSFRGDTGNADLDVVDASVVYNSADNSFTLTSTQAGAVGTVSSGPFGFRQYFWGVDTGSGTAQFAGNGITGVYFDATVQVILAPGTGLGLGSAGDEFLPFGSITYDGNVISTTFSASLLPSTGFTPGRYLWSLWTWQENITDPLGDAFGRYADFAPNNASFTAAQVPEPGGLVLMLAGIGALLLRRRGAQARSMR